MIDRFEGKYEFLSNFFPQVVVFRGIKWPTSEHAYQAMKTKEPAMWTHISRLSHPSLAKKAGRTHVCRNDWSYIKTYFMRQIVRAKFVQSDTLWSKLVDTGNQVLVEGNNWHDNEWGDCQCDKCKSMVGKNLLGNILMEIRNELKIME